MYEKMYDFKHLYNAHLAARKGKRNKAEVIEFEMNLSKNLCELQEQLSTKTYRPKGYTHFYVYEPKKRSIYAPSYSDRVVQHCLCDNILGPVLESRLIYDNAACRIGKGTHFAVYRLSDFLRRFYREHQSKGYFLKCDIRKFFFNIDHTMLKNKLWKVFSGESEIFDLLCKIIDSYEEVDGKGIPLGNQTSQWFALFYLDSIDRLIKEQLRIKYYSRYMDDFVMIHHSKEYLYECLEKIMGHCGSDLKLELNEKTQIFPIKNGVDYLGWRFCMTSTGKVIRKLRTSNKKRLKAKYKFLQKEYANGTKDFAAVRRCLVSVHGHLIHGHTYYLRTALSKKTVFLKNNFP